MWVKCDVCDKQFDSHDEGEIVNQRTFCDSCYEVLNIKSITKTNLIVKLKSKFKKISLVNL